jgi:hypothetical protein
MLIDFSFFHHIFWFWKTAVISDKNIRKRFHSTIFDGCSDIDYIFILKSALLIHSNAFCSGHKIVKNFRNEGKNRKSIKIELYG